MKFLAMLLAMAAAIPFWLVVLRLVQLSHLRLRRALRLAGLAEESTELSWWQRWKAGLLHRDPLYVEYLQQSAWRAAAGRTRLSEVVESGVCAPPQIPWLKGRSGPLEVRFDLDRERPGWTRLSLTGLGQGRAGLSLARRRDEERGDGEIATGEALFDGQVVVRGDTALALALLDAQARGRVAELMQGTVPVPGHEPFEVQAALDSGRLEVWIRHRRFSAPGGDEMSAVLERALAAAHGLIAPADLGARIAENLRADPEEAFRLRCLSWLAARRSRDPAADRAVRAALADGSDEVRLAAATALGEEGQATLLALIASERTEDGCAAGAVAALGDRLTAGQLETALVRALEGGRAAMAQACVTVLGQCGRPEAEGLLLRALRSDIVRIAIPAARALGRVGTAGAVAPLRAIAEATDHGGLDAAAHQAVAEIQARLHGAAHGQLSLAGDAAGALSLAADAPGQLSLAAPQPPGAEADLPAGEDPSSSGRRRALQ